MSMSVEYISPIGETDITFMFAYCPFHIGTHFDVMKCILSILSKIFNSLWFISVSDISNVNLFAP